MSDAALPDFLDALIVGGGAAGLYTALCLPRNFRVGIVTKEPLTRSASDWAQGGIAAAIAPDDSPVLHVEDTLRAGAGLCEPEAVALLVEKAASCIQSLVQMGVAFDRQGKDLALTLEAAHSRRRVLHAADTTGRAVIATLTQQVLDRPNIQVLPQAFVLDLWIAEHKCQGVFLASQTEVVPLRVGVVILATGGGGQVYAQTTNPALSTGDGVAMAWRAGAQLRDLEFMQFHPTALTKEGAPHFLISEAVRGEGAHLVDAEGHRFTFDYHPAGELAPRDIVSRAIFTHLQRTTPDPAAAQVWLDLRPIPIETIRHRFPNIIRVCQQWGIDVFQEPIPVAPAAHYWMGGVTTDSMSRTTLSGLYAVGETASTGVHGANRLASNSLLECLVFGAQLATLEISEGERESGRAGDKEDGEDTGGGEDKPSAFAEMKWQEQIAQVEQWRQDLSRLMWRSTGISREQQSLEASILQVESWRQAFASLPLTQALLTLMKSQTGRSNLIPFPAPATVLRCWGETRNLLDVAYLILKSAAFRTESRGGHYRSDYPQTDPNWQVHTKVEGQTWSKSKPVAQ